MLADAVSQISSKWWTFLLRGLVALVVAGFAFLQPAATATALVYVLAAYFIVTGIMALAAGFAMSGGGHWWALVLLGIVQVALGVILIVQPSVGPLALAFLFALWLVTTGVSEITAAITFRSYIRNEWLWILLGVITLVIGFYVVLYPGVGLLALVYTVGWYAVLAGLTLCALAFRIKSVGAEVAKGTATA